MSSTRFLEKLLDGAEVEWLQLGNYAEIFDGTHQTPQYQESGVPFVSVQNIKNLSETTKYISKKDYEKYKCKPKRDDLFMTRIGDIGTCAIVENDSPLAYYVTLALIRVDKEVILPKFLLHLIHSGIGKSELYRRTLHHAVPIKINLGDIGKISVPIPCPDNPKRSLKIQAEIVRVMDMLIKRTTELTTELTTEYIARKKQYNYYRDQLLTFSDDDVAWKPLSEIAQYSKTRISHDQLDNTNYVGVDNLLQNRAGKTESNHVPTSGNLTEYREGDILIGNIRPYLKKIWHADRVGGTNGDVLVVHPTDGNINPRYLYQVLADDKFFEYNMQHAKGAKMPRGNKPKIMEYIVPIPYPDDPEKSLAEQARIVSILDKFDALTNSISEGLPREIELRNKQYEYYRDLLLNFPKPMEEAA